VTSLLLDTVARRIDVLIRSWTPLEIDLDDLVVPASEETARLIDTLRNTPDESCDWAGWQAWRAELETNAVAVAHEMGDCSEHLSVDL